MTLNEVLQGYESEVKKAGAKVTDSSSKWKRQIRLIREERVKEGPNDLIKSRVKYVVGAVPKSTLQDWKLQETNYFNFKIYL